MPWITVNDLLFCANNDGRYNKTARYSTEFVIPGSGDFPRILEVIVHAPLLSMLLKALCKVVHIKIEGYRRKVWPAIVRVGSKNMNDGTTRLGLRLLIDSHFFSNPPF